jgi:hypothetical protein
MKQENIPLNEIKEEAGRLLQESSTEESQIGDYFTQKEYERRKGTFDVNHRH